jgi:hypothetical protein
MNDSTEVLKPEDQVVALGYCVQCKAIQTVKWSAIKRMKNGRTAATGVCPECGTAVYTYNHSIIKQVYDKLAEVRARKSSKTN